MDWGSTVALAGIFLFEEIFGNLKENHSFFDEIIGKVLRNAVCFPYKTIFHAIKQNEVG